MGELIRHGVNPAGFGKGLFGEGGEGGGGHT